MGWLLTVGGGAGSGVLDIGQCGVRLEGLRDVLGTLCFQVVAREAANVSRIEVLLAADSKRRVCAGDSRVLGRKAAYSSEVSVVLVLRALEMCIAPFRPK